MLAVLKIFKTLNEIVLEICVPKIYEINIACIGDVLLPLINYNVKNINNG